MLEMILASLFLLLLFVGSVVCLANLITSIMDEWKK